MRNKTLLIILSLLFPIMASAYIPDLTDFFYDLLKEANQGKAVAQAQVGHCYEHGIGVPVDYGQALYWYNKSAEKGNDRGQNGLGIMYLYGKGVQKDYTEALKWFQKAAEKGNPDAIYNVGTSIFYIIGGIVLGLILAFLARKFLKIIILTRQK